MSSSEEQIVEATGTPSLFSVGNRVRFTTFGLWRSGTVTAVDKRLVCIQPDRDDGHSWAVQWRNPAVHEVVPHIPPPASAPSPPEPAPSRVTGRVRSITDAPHSDEEWDAAEQSSPGQAG